MSIHRIKGLLSREITLITLNGKESKYFLHIIKPRSEEDAKALEQLKNKELTKLGLTGFDLIPFERETPFILYFEQPLCLTQIASGDYELSYARM